MWRRRDSRQAIAVFETLASGDSSILVKPVPDSELDQARPRMANATYACLSGQKPRSTLLLAV